ncbi:hypothetical protein BCR36DRAFT_588240 [Piromyces finnis]|uniref:Uncharacterized protein n=1 Tax=Piromyces finnis TaxID=1754191 RepID=A0A1Y1UN67_9FUNG|nr:hypothetical protein BCR36DRAFT_588240 [Piromyces finnis]|eukprot:ORX39500.1 hypothetical protein BCR36DRAFT_588240 [Piromyces finnis]
MNKRDYYNKGMTSINYNYLNTSQDNNTLFINDNQSLNIQTNGYDKNTLNKQNDLSNINYITHTNELFQNANQISMTTSSFKNNGNSTLALTPKYNKERESKIIEATNKIPIIRFYVFIKKFKAKCVLKILYQISYILNILDLNKRRNFINSIPFKLPTIIEKILLINFPIKIIKSILENYKNYRIPTTQEIIAPFLELLANLSSISSPSHQLPPINENNNHSFTSVNSDERTNNSISPLLLPQSELPYSNSPENNYIIQMPTPLLNKNLESNQNFDNISFEAKKKGKTVNIENIRNSSNLENHNDSYYLSKLQHDASSNKQQLKDAIMNIPKTDFQSNNNINNDNKEKPYNFLENNMMLQSNLTLFPLSPYITLNNTDFDTDVKTESTNTKTDNSSKKTLSIQTSPNFATVNNVPSSSMPSSAATTLSTVAASIAALKSSTSSEKHNGYGSSLSKIEKKNLSKIKNSNIVKNIVKNFEEINNYYKNALLETEEKTNNTKSAKRTYKKYGSHETNDNNDSNNDDEIKNIDNEDILEEEEEEEEENLMEKQDDEEGIDNENNIILSQQDKMKINEACDKMIYESKFMQESDLIDIKESTNLMVGCNYDLTTTGNDDNDSIDGMTEIIKDFSLENNFSDSNEDGETNSEISNNIFNSIVNIEDLDITRLTILLIESFVKLTDTEKEEFLNSEYFDLIKNHVMNIQHDKELELSSIFKDPKMLNEFESHIEALQQCVKERDDIINYYYQEIVNERIQNEKLLVFCENEQLEREETNKIISGLTKKIEIEEEYIKKLEVRYDMLVEKVKKYQSCCKHYEKSISLLSGNKPNVLKLINTQNFESAAILNNPPNFYPGTASPVDPNGRPGIAHLINKLSCEKISKNEEIQYLKSLLKSYNGKHIYLNENVIKKQIIEKTMATSTQTIPATVENVPIIPINLEKDLPGKKMMMEKYFEKQFAKTEETLVLSDDDDDDDNEEEKEREEEKHTPEIEDDEILQNRKSIDLSIIDDLNIFNEKHYHEKVLHNHQKSVEKDIPEDDTFSEYAQTLVN